MLTFGKKNQFMILADCKIYLIKVTETNQLSGNPSDLCLPLEINYFYKENSVFELTIFK